MIRNLWVAGWVITVVAWHLMVAFFLAATLVNDEDASIELSGVAFTLMILAAGYTAGMLFWSRRPYRPSPNPERLPRDARKALAKERARIQLEAAIKRAEREAHVGKWSDHNDY